MLTNHDDTRPHDDEMQGMSVIVTGATSGIGRATALKFAAHNARVMLFARNEKRLAEVADEIRADGGIAEYVAVDVTDEAAAQGAVEKAANRFDSINHLVNAAGQISNGSIRDTSLAAWDALMQTNVRAVFHLMQLAVPHLEQTQGSIVNVSSVTGLRAFPNVLAYCVSKAAVDQLTRCAALELAAAGVRVNAVNPGVVATELHKRGGMKESDYQEFLARSAATHPLGRTGTAEEVAELIYFLASPRASWITGATYSIDGGRAQTCAR